MNEVVEIDISKIVPNKSQPRLTFYDDSVKSKKWLITTHKCS